MDKNKVLLLIMDGWGIGTKGKESAINSSNTPNFDKFTKEYPNSLLQASGLEVGLPSGVMGNSEVGHMNIGAGRVVYQLNTMIDKKVEDGEFFENTAFLKAFDHVQKHSSSLHFFVLMSDGNVHSNIGHIWAMLELIKKKKTDKAYFHLFMDGRDTLPHSGLNFVRDFLNKARGIAEVATISGRYYAMDRDNRWDRIKKAYDAIVHSQGEFYEDPLNAIQKSYDSGITDEFILPKVNTRNSKPVATVNDNDSIIFLNYRADRAREITRAFIQPDFDNFTRKEIKNLHFVSMSEYDTDFEPYVDAAFKTPELNDILGQVLSDNKKKQMRMAETEKYAHVTFFFNCGREKPYDLEDRLLIPSPKVASYDLKPEMSSLELTETALKVIENNEYDFIALNYANCDMVGHTGVFEAVVKAVETVDLHIGKVVERAVNCGYHILLTADHGNAEKMLDERDNIFTAHTTNPVPLILISSKNNYRLKNGILGDIAPTILEILNISKPVSMTGKSLLEEI